jgi:ribonucleoside-diphosphate reductase alpha chain
LQLLFGGRVPGWDTSGVRAAGARLRTFGGRASGPQPLIGLFQYTIEVFKGSAGRQLTTLECHDLVCKIADIVVVGGVRRSALISLSNLTDDRMRTAKSGMFPPHRYLANNSVAYTIKPDMESYLKEMGELYVSKAGERGIFSRIACQRKVAESGRRDPDWAFGTNPCSEIILRPAQFCNLSEVIIRPDDTEATLHDKIQHATVLGTLQSTLTNFKFLRKCWADNCEEERLLGVSLTGIMDHSFFNGHKLSTVKEDELKKTLTRLKGVAIKTNAAFAKQLGVNPSAAVTCVKPSGTVSQLCDTASGIHPRYAASYIRRVRNDNKDPVTQWLKDSGVTHEPDTFNEHCTVFSFPLLSPPGSVCTGDITAVEHLKTWQLYNDYWCEHKPSITLQYKPEEFLELADYMYKHFDKISGIALLPKDDHMYTQAPYEEISEEEYQSLLKQTPEALDWEKLQTYETTDNTSVQPELACTGGACEL